MSQLHMEFGHAPDDPKCQGKIRRGNGVGLSG